MARPCGTELYGALVAVMGISIGAGVGRVDDGQAETGGNGIDFRAVADRHLPIPLEELPPIPGTQFLGAASPIHNFDCLSADSMTRSHQCCATLQPQALD